MQLAKSLSDLFVALVSSLQNNDIRFSIAGAFAVSIYAQPRATSDIDLVTFTDTKTKERITAILHQNFHLIQTQNEPLPIRFFEIWRHVVKAESEIPIIIPIDFIAIPDDYLSMVLNRSIVLSLEGVDIPFVSRADLVVMKLGSTRAKDMDDVERLMEDVEPMDLEYIRSWARKFSLPIDSIIRP